jgi:hypothetical protein
VVKSWRNEDSSCDPFYGASRNVSGPTDVIQLLTVLIRDPKQQAEVVNPELNVLFVDNCQYECHNVGNLFACRKRVLSSVLSNVRIAETISFTAHYV